MILWNIYVKYFFTAVKKNGNFMLCFFILFPLRKPKEQGTLNKLLSMFHSSLNILALAIFSQIWRSQNTKKKPVHVKKWKMCIFISIL